MAYGYPLRMPVPPEETRLKEPLLTELIGGLDGWEREGETITKTFTFKGFRRAIAFVDRVADAAHAAKHHPDIHVERYRFVRIVLTTHATGGISQADVDLARAIDGLATDAAS